MAKRPCHLCSKSMSSAYNLRRHLRVVHQIIVNPSNGTQQPMGAVTTVQQIGSVQYNSQVPSNLDGEDSNKKRKSSKDDNGQYSKKKKSADASFPSMSNHTCSVCSKSMSSAYNLRRHLKIVHQLEPNSL